MHSPPQRENTSRRTVPRPRPAPAQPDPPPPPATAGAQADRKIMHARLAAMATPRPTDTPEAAALRRVLADRQVMDRVTATVDAWPPLDDEQRDTVAALLSPARRRLR